MRSILLQLTAISDYDNYKYIHLQLDIKRISILLNHKIVILLFIYFSNEY